MIISFFKKHHPANIFALPLFTLLLWLPAFWYNPTDLIFANQMPFAELVLSLVAGYHKISLILSLILLVFQAFLLNNMVERHQLLKEQGLLPALCYVVIMCSFPQMLFLHPALIANTFLIIALNKLLNFRLTEKAFPRIFDTAFLISISSLFYYPSGVMYLLLFIALVVLRSFSWREWITSLVGICLPYIFVMTWYFWFDQFEMFISEKVFHPVMMKSFPFHSESSFYILSGALVILCLFALIPYLRQIALNTVQISKRLIIVAWFVIISLAAFLLASDYTIIHISLVAIPLSIYLANYFQSSKYVWIREFIFLILLLSILYHHLVKLDVIVGYF